MKEIFLSIVRSLLEVLFIRSSSDKESLEHDFDNLCTHANLLYHHGVHLASVHMIDESTITKLRNVVDLLTGLGVIPAEFEALELSSVATSCSRDLHFLWGLQPPLCYRLRNLFVFMSCITRSSGRN